MIGKVKGLFGWRASVCSFVSWVGRTSLKKSPLSPELKGMKELDESGQAGPSVPQCPH